MQSFFFRSLNGIEITMQSKMYFGRLGALTLNQREGMVRANFYIKNLFQKYEIFGQLQQIKYNVRVKM